MGDRLTGIPSNNGGQTLFEEKPELAGGHHQFIIDQTSTIYISSSGLSQDEAKPSIIIHRGLSI
jgi:hypothetical protein